MRRDLVSIVLCVALAAPAFVTQSPGAFAAKRPKRPLECRRISAHVAPGSDTKQSFRYCKGHVLSKDGTSLLDTSVTMPAKGDGPFPLMVILHGLTQSKKSYESNPKIKTDREPDGQTVEGVGSRYHYNNLWFASRGYMVLTYTARGWHIFRNNNGIETISRSSCTKDGLKSESVDGSAEEGTFEPACYIQIAHLKYEIADTQYLIGRLVDGTLTDARRVKARPRQIGVTGISYGGGQTWTLTRKNEWRSPRGTRIRIDAAAPLIGWTDIVDALMPNGRRSDTEGKQSLAARLSEPAGVKNDYVDVFYAALENLGTEGFGQVADYLERWKERIDEGEPYEGDPYPDEPNQRDPLLQGAFEKLLTKRSAFFIPKDKRGFDTPIFAVQGFTDGIFQATQSIKMYNRLQAERDRAGQKKYPMSMYLGDWGHSPSQSKQDEFEYIANSLNAWMNYYVKGAGNKPASDVEARTTICDGSRGDLGALYRAPTWTKLNEGEAFSWEDTNPATLTTPSGDPRAQRLVPSDGDPDRGDFNGVPDNSCRSTDNGVDDSNFASPREVAPEDGPVRMLGLPEVSFSAEPQFDGMYVAARLWDVDPGADSESVADDVQTLVTRGVYRLEGAGEQEVRFRLFGNAYTFPVGHTIKLELTADDSPSWQVWKQNDDPGNGTIQIGNVDVSIPTANCEMRLPECDL